MGGFIRIVAPVALALLLIAITLDLGRLVLAPTREASIDAVRVRNAMVAELGSPAATQWGPEAVPAEYRWESNSAPDFFASRVAEILPTGPAQEPALTVALRLARHLRETSRPGPAIQANSRETYEKITAGEGGYCSDYTQAFNALALAAGLQVREWGFTWSDMANGHAFNEVWEPALQKWIFIDSFISFYVVDRSSGVPMSALEFRSKLMEGPTPDEISVVSIVPERFGFDSVERALAWFRRGVPRMFLVLGNSVYSYDADPLIQAAEALPRSVEMTLAILVGQHPRFLFVPREADGEVAAQVGQIRWELAWVVVKLVAAAVIAVYLLVVLWRRLRQGTASGASAAKADGG